MGIRQVAHPCPHCGSYYRRDDRCNICGEVVQETIAETEDKFSRAGRSTVGKIWNAKLHRYMKRSDMK